MTRKIILISLALVVALGIGCRMSLIKNIADEPMSFNTDKKPSMEEVEKAIIRAGASLGWRIKSQSSGNLNGVLRIRKHTAIVDIKFDTENYSITYKDSTNLKYDGTNIHSNYNGWIDNLSNAINAQLSSI